MLERTFKAVIALLVMALAGFAGAADQVEWHASAPAGKPGDTVTIELKATIAKGYHLYSTKAITDGPSPTVIEATTPLTLAGAVESAKPTVKLDRNFGKEVEFYENEATFRVPVKLGKDGSKGSLKVTFMTCNDRMCVPPATVTVPLGDSVGSVPSEGSAASKKDQVAWQASLPTGKPGDTVTVELKATIAKGYHLYSTKTVGDGPSPTVIEAVTPLALAGAVEGAKPTVKLDSNFGKEVEFYENETTFRVPVKLGADGAKGSLKVTFMTCNDRMCVPPATVTVPLGGSVGSVPVAGSSDKPEAKQDATADAFTKSVADAKAGGILAFAGLSFVLGLFSLLTPCVFPMVPITVSYFAKRRENLGAKAGLAQAGAYCFGIIGSFAGFGLLVTALFGASGINRFATNPFVNLALGVLFVVLALSLFGIYQLTLPSSVTNRFSPQGKAGLLGPILMGLTFTLTSFTCTVPFVGTILASAAQGDILFPLIGMLSFGTAFAVPFFLLALFPQYLAKLPKSGSWMETMKAFMGFLELAAAIKFFSNADLVWSTGILSRPIFLGLWVLFALGAALFLFGLLKLPHVNAGKPGPYRYVFATLSVGVAVWLATAIPGRSLGEAEAFLPPGKSDWIQTYDQGAALARTSGKPLLVNFTGVTCTNCRWMEKNMFPRPDVAKEFGNYVLVELYTDRQRADDMKNKNLEQSLTGVVTLPVYVAMTPEGKALKVFQGSTRDESEFVGFLKAGRSKLAANP